MLLTFSSVESVCQLLRSELATAAAYSAVHQMDCSLSTRPCRAHTKHIASHWNIHFDSRLGICTSKIQCCRTHSAHTHTLVQFIASWSPIKQPLLSAPVSQRVILQDVSTSLSPATESLIHPERGIELSQDEDMTSFGLLDVNDRTAHL